MALRRTRTLLMTAAARDLNRAQHARPDRASGDGRGMRSYGFGSFRPLNGIATMFGSQLLDRAGLTRVTIGSGAPTPWSDEPSLVDRHSEVQAAQRKIVARATALHQRQGDDASHLSGPGLVAQQR
jgi:hypothetical protein